MAKALVSHGVEAETLFKKALEISTEVGLKEVACRAHIELGRLYVDLANVKGEELLISAEDQSDQARKVLDEIAVGIEEPQLKREFLRRRLADVNLPEEKLAATGSC